MRRILGIPSFEIVNVLEVPGVPKPVPSEAETLTLTDAKLPLISAEEFQIIVLPFPGVIPVVWPVSWVVRV